MPPLDLPPIPREDWQQDRLADFERRTSARIASLDSLTSGLGAGLSAASPTTPRLPARPVPGPSVPLPAVAPPSAMGSGGPGSFLQRSTARIAGLHAPTTSPSSGTPPRPRIQYAPRINPTPAPSPTPDRTESRGNGLSDAPSSTGVPQGSGEIEAYIRQAARQRGIDPDTAVAVARSEGGLENPVRQSDYVNPRTGQREESYGPFQLYLGGGLGNAALEAGIDPRNPSQWRQAVDFALDAVTRSGWGAWYGAKAIGVTGFDGIGQAAADTSAGISRGATGSGQATGEQAGGWLDLARSQLNKPYIWGSAGGRSDFSSDPAGFDCSGFVSYVLKQGMGVDLPAFTGSAYEKTKAVPLDDIRPGDVVFYNMDNPDPAIQHMALYIGNGQIIQAGGTGRNVNTASLYALGTPEVRRAAGAHAGEVRERMQDSVLPKAAQQVQQAPRNSDVLHTAQQGQQADDPLRRGGDMLRLPLGEDDLNDFDQAQASARAQSSPQSVDLTFNPTPPEGGWRGRGAVDTLPPPNYDRPIGPQPVPGVIPGMREAPSDVLSGIRQGSPRDPNALTPGAIDFRTSDRPPPVAADSPFRPGSAIMRQSSGQTVPPWEVSQDLGYGTVDALVPEPIRNAPIDPGLLNQVLIAANVPTPGRQQITEFVRANGIDVRDVLANLADVSNLVGIGTAPAQIAARQAARMAAGTADDVARVASRALSSAGDAQRALPPGRPANDWLRPASDVLPVQQAGESAGDYTRRTGLLPGGREAPASAVQRATTAADPQSVQRAMADADLILQERAAVASGAGRTPRPAPEVDTVLNALVKAREQVTDRRAPLRAVETYLENRLGRPLNFDERVWMRSRVYEGRADAALARLERTLKPALEPVGRNGDVQHLDAFLEQMDNIDKANAVARTVQNRILDTDLGNMPGTTALRRAEASLRQRERLLNLAQIDSSDDAIAAAQKRVDSARRVVDRLRGRLDEATQAARDEQLRIAQTEGGIARDRRAFSGGASAQDEAAVRAAWEQRLGPERARTLFAAADAVWDTNRAWRQRLREAGVFSDDQVRFFEEHFPHYVKTNILDHLSDAAIDSLPPGGRTFGVGSNGVKRLTEAGTTKVRQSPLSSVVDLALRSEELAQRNTVMRAVAGWADQPSMQGFVRRLADGEDAPKGWTALGVLEDGAKGRVMVVDELVPALTLNGAPPKLLEVALKAAGTPLRAGATALRPAFIITNMVNDMLTAFYRFPVESPSLREALQSPLDVARGYKAAFGGNPELIQRVREAGGSIGTKSRYDNPDAIVRELTGEHVWVRPIRRPEDLRAALRDPDFLRDVWGATADVAGMVWSRPIGVLSRRVEEAPRLAAAIRAERQGQNATEVAFRKRTATADFAAGGDFMRQANAAIPFLNAAAQGAAEFGGSTLKNPAKATAAMATIASFIVGTDVYNRSVSPEDYADVSKFTKDTGIVILSPFAPEAGGKRGLLYIPLRGGLGTLVPLVREALGKLYGDDPRAWQEILRHLWNTTTSVDPDTSTFLVPPVKTAVELGSNYDLFRDQPIVSRSRESLPTSEQFDERTSQTARHLSRSNLPLVGGASPLEIDYGLKGFSPGPAEAALGVSDAIIRATGNALPDAPSTQPKGARDIPIIGGVLGRFLKTVGNERQNKAYDLADKLIAERERIEVAREQATPEYQAATPEEQQTRLRRIRREVQDQARDELGILTAAEKKASDAAAQVVGAPVLKALKDADVPVPSSFGETLTRNGTTIEVSSADRQRLQQESLALIDKWITADLESADYRRFNAEGRRRMLTQTVARARRQVGDTYFNQQAARKKAA